MVQISLIAAMLTVAGAAGDPDQFPFALHRSMEIDDLDREIQRIHDGVLLRRARLASSQRLATRGLVSRAQLEREAADARYQEAREAETIAYRALKLHERDVLGNVAPVDEQKAYTLLRDWVRKQAAIARVELDFQGYLLRETRALHQRNAATRRDLEEAELAVSTAEASVALSTSREAQIDLELATRAGAKRYDAAEYYKLKSAYLQARARYFEATAATAQRRLDAARERARNGLMSPPEVTFLERAATDADAAVAAEKKALADHESSPPAPPPGKRGST